MRTQAERSWTPPETREVRTPGGRVLRYCLYGPKDGVRLVVHGGTPSTRWLTAKGVERFERAGIRAMVYDRPGYGGSTRQPGRQVVDAVEDVRLLVDAEGWDRFATFGGSGGGPHTLACAARLPDRVTRCAAMVSVAPYDAHGLDWYAGMSPGNVEEFTLAQQGEAAYRPLVERIGREAAERVSRSEVPIGDEYAMPESDLAEARRRLAENTPGQREVGVQQWSGGFDGWIDDCIAFVRPWGFGVDEITVPVGIWYGPDDVLVPRGHADWLLGQVPGAKGHELAGGHLASEADLAAINGWLAAAA
ncbi:alpha/beta fold hydrolase [Flindersiella endophytica]